MPVNRVTPFGFAGRACAAVALALAASWLGASWTGAAPRAVAPDPRAQDQPASLLPATGNHRYRIVGKVRPFFFWIGSSNVGGARLTWHPLADGGRVIDLLIGADPERAPRGIDDWGYVREEVRGASARVFGVRSVTDAASLSEAEQTLDRNSAAFGALCSTVGDGRAQAWTSTVIVPRRVSYRRFDQLLDAVASAPKWEHHQTPRPRGTAPGFLAALDRVIGASVEAARAGTPHHAGPTRYVYKATQYDLRLKSEKRIDTLTIDPRTYHRVVHGDFEIVNLTTGDTTGFTVTYGTTDDLAGVPLQATYEPRWWLKLELALDDRLDVPADPAADPSTLAKMRQACGTAMGTPLH